MICIVDASEGPTAIEEKFKLLKSQPAFVGGPALLIVVVSEAFDEAPASAAITVRSLAEEFDHGPIIGLLKRVYEGV